MENNIDDKIIEFDQIINEIIRVTVMFVGSNKDSNNYVKEVNDLLSKINILIDDNKNNKTNKYLIDNLEDVSFYITKDTTGIAYNLINPESIKDWGILFDRLNSILENTNWYKELFQKLLDQNYSNSDVVRTYEKPSTA